jgi:hypothetical protein
MDNNRYRSKRERTKEEQVLIIGIAKILIVIGILIILVFLYNRFWVVHQVGSSSSTGDMAPTGQFGDFIGGFVGTIFNLVGAILLFYTLREQRDNFTHEKIEERFYEMIRIHRENVDQVEFSYYDHVSANVKETAKGRKVFKIVFNQFKELWYETEHLFDKRADEIYLPDYLIAVEKNEEREKRSLDPIQMARLDICYLVIFFGVGVEDSDTVLDVVNDKYRRDFVFTILQFIRLKPARMPNNSWENWWNINLLKEKKEIFDAILEARKDTDHIDEILSGYIIGDSENGDEISVANLYYNDGYLKYYGGHQFRLGHYLRHIFQTIRYIDEQEALSFDEKYSYVKFFRAQMSNYEQAVYFLNSLSTLGRVSELEKRQAPYKSIETNKQLITKYCLIKNLPRNEIVKGVLLTQYYPDIKYEAILNQGVNERRAELRKQYS